MAKIEFILLFLFAAASSEAQTDTIKIKAFIDTANIYLYRLNDSRLTLDSAFTYCKLALDLSNKIHNPDFQNRSMERIGYYYYLAHDNDKAISIQKQYISYLRHQHDLYGEAAAWNSLGYYYALILDSNHFCCQQSQLLYKQSGHPLEAIGELKAWGDNLLGANKLDSAEHVLTEVLQEYRKVGYQDLQYTYDLLADVSYTRGDLNGELSYRLEVIKSMESTRNFDYAGGFYYRLAHSYFMLKRYEESIFYAQKAITYDGRHSYMCMNLVVKDFLAIKRPLQALIFMKNYVHTYPSDRDDERKIVDEASGLIYVDLKQYKEAETFLVKALRFSTLPVNFSNGGDMILQTNYVSSRERLINLYLLTRQFGKARYYLNKIPESFAKNLTPQYLIDLELIRFRVDSAYGNYISAIQHYQTYKKMNDSIYSVQNMRSVADIEMKYQTEKRENAIKSLETQQQVQKITTQRTVLQRNVALAAIVGALILAAFAFNGYRRKKLSGMLISQKNNQLQLLLDDKEQSSILIKEKNNQLQELLIEKDWLLKEVNHRVKNNLHTVFCLLESQAKYLKDDALKAVEVSQHRIFAMSLVHQKLYQSEDISTVDMGIYLPEFISYLKESFETGQYIRFKTDITPITLNIAQAIPVALIINEAVTNAIKYAFPNGRGGIVAVSFRINNGSVIMSIADNGIGIDYFDHWRETKSLGLVLMEGLAEDLHGVFTVTNKHGTHVQIVFPMPVATV